MSSSLTWLGHSAFRLDSPGGLRIYVDPWLTNPNCPAGEQEPERVDLIALTHGHPDHVGETVALAGRFGCPVIAIDELRAWIAERQGVPYDIMQAGNKGGALAIAGVKITFTDARHSSSFEGAYLGEPAGLVIELEDSSRLYFAGDTCAFGDMQLIGRLHEPDLAVLPIGDRFTMGPREAAVALELLGVTRCVPCHHGTGDFLTGTPAQLREHAPGVEVIELTPGVPMAL
jgi:L-ascorbate metabolism protein UlaG (beta-lactamase superfamily)